MYVCPVCNGLIEYVKYCPRCGEKMKILDRVENYYDDYSPYLSYDITDLNDGVDKNICIHAAVCSTCGYKSMAYIENVVE